MTLLASLLVVCVMGSIYATSGVSVRTPIETLAIGPDVHEARAAARDRIYLEPLSSRSRIERALVHESGHLRRPEAGVRPIFSQGVSFLHQRRKVGWDANLLDTS
jgi:hypothetical protein